MSTEFIRCPACRSLIPAVSKVCRMCGAELASGTKAEDESAKKSGRVRQRTMSQSNEELAQAAQQLRSDFTPVSPTIHSGIDPLSAYIEEVDSHSAAVQPLGSGLVKSSQDLKKPTDVGRTANISSESKTAAEAGQTIAVSQEVLDGGAKPRVIVETGARRPGKASGLSFGKSREDSQSPRALDARGAERGGHASPVAVPPTQATRTQLDSGSAHGSAHKEDPLVGKLEGAGTIKPLIAAGRREAEERPAPHSSQKKSESAVMEQQLQSEVEEELRPSVMKSDGKGIYIPLKGGKISGGRLFGWLVSFKDSDGRATELREGRFFVTRSSVKESDLVIDHESISVPHALMHISSDMGVRVHDVISERGLFVKRRGSDDYQRMSETVEVQHGDYIRFGEVEFQVCLISEVGMK